VKRRTFLALGLLVALMIAGFASYYASSHPDGLNFVAEKAGFVDREQPSATSDGPFAGYQTSGIADDRLSGGVAGVAGALLVLTIGSGLFWVLRRRTPADEPTPDGA
jgi:cobalt/nickel transport protein